MTMSFVSILTLLATPGGVERGTIQVAGIDGDKVYYTSVSPERILRTPGWKDDSKEPPLSPLKALNLAETERRILIRDLDLEGWELESASLKRAHGDHWYYEVGFRGLNKPVDTTTGHRPSLVVLVLMDGTVVEPVVLDRFKFISAYAGGAFEIDLPDKHPAAKDDDPVELKWSDLPWRHRFRLVVQMIFAPKLLYQIEKLEVYRDYVWVEYSVTNLSSRRKYLQKQHLEAPTRAMDARDSFNRHWQPARFDGCILYKSPDEYVSVESGATVRYRAILNQMADPQPLQLVEKPRPGWHPENPAKLRYKIGCWWFDYLRLGEDDRDRERVFVIGFGETPVSWFDQKSPESYRHGGRLYP
jgi:hypothetical protein